MIIKIIKVLIPCFVLMVYSVQAGEPSKNPNAEAAKKAQKDQKDPHHVLTEAELEAERKRFILPRHLEMPPITFYDDALERNEKMAKTWFIGHPWRFQVLFLFASWSDHSKVIAKEINARYAELRVRGVGFLGVFSHYTAEASAQWIQEINPQFKIGYTTLSFINMTENPKVPTIWVLDYRNFIIMKLEIPSDADIKDMFRSLNAMTNF